MVDTAAAPQRRAINVYDRLGVRTIINAAGAQTALSGSLMSPEVAEAMLEASKYFVYLDELNDAVGKKIAEATGAEAGCVTSGAAGGLLLATAACIAGCDPAKIDRLPQTDGMANEVILHRVHRMKYDIMFQAAGGKLVEIGIPRGTAVWELEDAINERTACVAWVDSPSVVWGALPFETVVEVAHKHNVPVVVDAASTLPPLDHLRRWIRAGADLVIYSGGKGIRGPQDSGMLAGRADLIAAARANGSPNRAIGRAAKVSKEAMVGLAVALDRFLTHDHEADYAAHLEQAELLLEALSGRGDVRPELTADPEQYPDPVIRLLPTPNSTWTANGLLKALQGSEPPVYARVERDLLEVHTHCLCPGDAEQVAETLSTLLDRQTR